MCNFVNMIVFTKILTHDFCKIYFIYKNRCYLPLVEVLHFV